MHAYIPYLGSAFFLPRWEPILLAPFAHHRGRAFKSSASWLRHFRNVCAKRRRHNKMAAQSRRQQRGRARR